MKKGAVIYALRRLGAHTGILLVVAACSSEVPRPTTAGSALLVSVRSGAIDAPDTATAGWSRVRVEEDGEGHIVVVFRMPAALSDHELAEFLSALDTAAATPPPAVALGGPEVGDTGEVVLELTPGLYVIGCVRRGRDGHRHANSGEAKLLTVRARGAGDSRSAAAPQTSQDVPMMDFAYGGVERWPAGNHTLRVENRGKQDHQLRIARLRDGASMKDWMNAEDPGRLATPVSGVARMGPGTVAYLPVELAPGGYVLFCLVTDAASGKMHVELGMLRHVQVD